MFLVDKIKLCSIIYIIRQLRRLTMTIFNTAKQLNANGYKALVVIDQQYATLWINGQPQQKIKL